jgi:hypothetical protein
VELPTPALPVRLFRDLVATAIDRADSARSTVPSSEAVPLTLMREAIRGFTCTT